MRHTLTALFSSLKPAAAQPSRARGMRVLHAKELPMVSGGLGLAGEVIKVIQGGALPPKKR